MVFHQAVDWSLDDLPDPCTAFSACFMEQILVMKSHRTHKTDGDFLMPGIAANLVFVKGPEIPEDQVPDKSMFAVVVDKSTERCQEPAGGRLILHRIQYALLAHGEILFQFLFQIIRKLVV